jgi:hypothetical protein
MNIDIPKCLDDIDLKKLDELYNKDTQLYFYNYNKCELLDYNYKK